MSRDAPVRAVTRRQFLTKAGAGGALFLISQLAWADRYPPLVRNQRRSKRRQRSPALDDVQDFDQPSRVTRLPGEEKSTLLGFSPINLRPKTFLDCWRHLVGIRKTSQTSFVENDFSIDGDLEDS
ncbi:MAG: twin-arginine translocation signal domain-containing protein, partial [Chloroflexi bacterium]